MEISIRAHHLLCTSLFSGHGYSEGFTAGLEKTVDLLHDGEDHEVALLDRPDRVCALCPKLVTDPAEECAEENNHVVITDRKVLAALGVEPGKTYPYSFLLAAAADKLTEEEFQNICGHCGWNDGGFCSYGELKKRLAELRAAVGLKTGS